MLLRTKTDYARPDHRAFVLKCAMRFGDAALCESILLRMTVAEREENESPPVEQLVPRVRVFADAWFASYTTGDDFVERLSSCRLRKSPHLRATKQWRAA